MNQPSSYWITIAGGGPAGITLGYLLARSGIETLVLESQDDFDRDFRGDTLHAGVLEIFDSLGLADEILELPHHKIRTLSAGATPLVNFAILKTKFPWVTMIAQSVFLDFLCAKARKFPQFHIEMGASARDLIFDPETDRVTGLQYRKNGIHTEVESEIVIACDGRGSRMRKAAELDPVPVTDPMEVLWFRLPRLESDQDQVRSGFLTGATVPFILLERPDYYQIAAVINPGDFGKIRDAGLPAFHQHIRTAAPILYQRAVSELDDWKKLQFLHVEGSRLESWWKPGLLLIGDAAHVMTPVGGVGINYAIWDAVETANVLVPLLKTGSPIESVDLDEIQRRRESPTRLMQSIQRFAGRRLLNQVAAKEPILFQLPLPVRLIMKIPGLRSIPPRIIALGGKRTECKID